MVTANARIFSSTPDWVAPSLEAEFWQEEYTRSALREITLQEKISQLEKVVAEKSTQINELTQQNDALKYRLTWLLQQVFGRKSEKSQDTNKDNKQGQQQERDQSGETSGDEMENPPENKEQDVSPADEYAASGQNDTPTENGNPTPQTNDQVETKTDGKDPADGPKKRGKKKGDKGYGRKPRLNLPFEEILHDLPIEEQCCPICGKKFIVFPGTEDSEEIHWEVRLIRHIHKRARYKPDCDCGAVSGIVTAPPPPKLIPKGMFAGDFWAHLILEKFLFQRPLYRVRQMLALEGLSVSQGTLTGGLKRIMPLLEPLFKLIVERSRAAHHWQMDETRWLVFEEMEGKKGYRWWLWVVVTRDTIVYLLDPTRSSKVPKIHLGEFAEGILNVDRYSAYKALHDLIRLAYCWCHVRRDFIRIRDGYSRLRAWAEEWIERIDQLFHINAQRLKVLFEPRAFEAQDQILREALQEMADSREAELKVEKLHTAQRGALESLGNHWTGLTIFVDHPEVPMDNNESERRLRNPIMGRKGYYGSGSIWSGILSAMLFSIMQTFLKNQLDPYKFLLAYFEACAQNGGRVPKDISSFLPWNISEERRAAWRITEGFP